MKPAYEFGIKSFDKNRAPVMVQALHGLAVCCKGIGCRNFLPKDLHSLATIKI